MSQIRDVAQSAGVSTATVSHVVNGTHYVSEGLRTKVLAAMAELNYQPSSVARSLRVKATHTVGLLISDIELPFFATIARAVQDTVKNLRTVIVCNTDEDSENEAAHLRMMWSRRVDGLIVAPTGSNSDLLAKIQASGLPIVLIDRASPGFSAPLVGIDNRRAACEATSYLITMGHKRIGLIAGLAHVSTIVQRVQGYRDALAGAGLPVDESLIRYTNSRAPSARERTLELLALTPPITAILGTVSDLTLGAVQVLISVGRINPANISVLSFDDPDWAAIMVPSITAVRQPSHLIGQIAAKTLLGMIQGEAPAQQDILLEAQLIIRDSVQDRRSQVMG